MLLQRSRRPDSKAKMAVGGSEGVGARFRRSNLEESVDTDPPFATLRLRFFATSGKNWLSIIGRQFIRGGP